MSAGAPACRASRTASVAAPSSIPPSTSPRRRCAAPTASRSSRSSPPTRRSREAGWDEELPYDADRIGCLIGTGIGGIGTLEHGKETLMEKGAERRLAAGRPADDGQRRRRRRGHAPRAPRPVLLDPVRLRGGRALDRRGRPHDPDRRRRRGRHRRLGGRADAARHRRLRGARRAVGQGHLAPVRRPARRLRDGRGRRGADPRGRREGPRARRHDPRPDRRLRRQLGRPPPDRPAPGRRRRRAGDAARARGRGLRPAGRRVRQRARHLDAAQRPRGDRRDQGRCSATTSRSPR